jgi:hypothetical protein
MAQVVPIDQVIPLSDSSSPYAVIKMMRTLVKQGQIEPLQVHPYGGKYIVFQDDPWANEIIYAARQLGWPSLIIVVMKRYEN